MKQEIKQKVIEIVAPYVSPSEIEEHFGIKYQTIYHYCNKHHIPKWRSSRSQRKSEMLKHFHETEKQMKDESINEAKRLINGCY
jgi:DNA invertase Pin-like site-specific DNA recombinase